MNVKLYHGHISTCSQKVRLALAEKGVEYDNQLLNLRAGEQYAPEYRKLNPNAVVPTLVHGNDVIRESSVINEYIDEAFDGPPLLPDGSAQRAAARLWTKQLDEGIHAAIVVLSFCIAFRNDFLTRSAEEMQAFYQRMNNPDRQGFYESAIAQGLDHEGVRPALRRFQKLLRDMETALSAGDWLVGDRYTLADLGFVPYLLRLEHLGLGPMWSPLAGVTDWYARVRQRQSYTAAIESWLPGPAVEGMTRAGQAAWPKIAELLA